MLAMPIETPTPRPQSAKARRKAARRKANRRPRDELGPTPETARKLVPDHVLELQRAGVLTQDHVNAADDIRTLWGALYAFRPNRRAYGLSAGGASGTASDPMSGMTAAEARLWQDIWKPWADEYGSMPLKGMGYRATVLELVVTIVCENYPPTPQVKPIVRDALDHWAALRAHGRRAVR